MQSEKKVDVKTSDDAALTRVRPNNVHSDAVRAMALAYFRQGLGYKRVAKLLGISVFVVRDWGRIYRRGKFKVQVSDRVFQYDDSVRARVIELWRKCMNYHEVARRTGICVSTCRSWVLKAYLSDRAGDEN